MSERREWLARARHLPPALRDFHAQKDVFKALHDWMPEDTGNFEMPSWVDGQVYTIDYFLRFMAVHGYTLQRSRADVPFCDLTATVATLHERMDSALAAALAESRTPTSDTGGPAEDTQG